MEKKEMLTGYFDEYIKNYKRYRDFFNYEDGCVLLGAKNLYEATGDEKYFTFIENYLKYFISDDGEFMHFDMSHFNIDSINSGKILFFMYDKTGEEKYKKAIEFVMERLKAHPRCKCGSFFHKEIYPYQIWLDGLYMAQPFYMEYETRFNNKEHYNDIISQFRNVQKYLYNEEKGLCYHAYDETKSIFWADKETGRSKNFWLRSMGWYMMALVDTMDKMSIEIYEQYRELQDTYKLMLNGLLRYQDHETKLFYQVIDRSDVPGNYLETSGSEMIAYSVLKACRMGIINREKYESVGKGIIDGLIENKIAEADGKLHLTGICSVAGLGPENDTRRDGTVEYYLSEPVVSDESKAVGCFMMAYAQYLMICE